MPVAAGLPYEGESLEGPCNADILATRPDASASNAGWATWLLFCGAITMLGPFRWGVGWLSGLTWLPLRRLRRYKQQSRIRPIHKAAPKTDPTTMPAICPPDKELEVPAAAVVVLDADGEAEEVEEGNNGGTENIDGMVTPSHRLVTCEATQQESVAFGELSAQ